MISWSQDCQTFVSLCCKYGECLLANCHQSAPWRLRVLLVPTSAPIETLYWFLAVFYWSKKVGRQKVQNAVIFILNRRMHEGFPDYGCYINPSKSLANFHFDGQNINQGMISKKSAEKGVLTWCWREHFAARGGYLFHRNGRDDIVSAFALFHKARIICFNSEFWKKLWIVKFALNTIIRTNFQKLWQGLKKRHLVFEKHIQHWSSKWNRQRWPSTLLEFLQVPWVFYESVLPDDT